jgi:hypothetical protein
MKRRNEHAHIEHDAHAQNGTVGDTAASTQMALGGETARSAAPSR